MSQSTRCVKRRWAAKHFILAAQFRLADVQRHVQREAGEVYVRDCGGRGRQEQHRQNKRFDSSETWRIL